MKRFLKSRIVLAGVALLWTGVASAQTGAPSRSGGAAAAQAPSAASVTKVTPGMTLEQVLAKPDSAVLEGPDGKRITVGELRRLKQKADQITAGGGQPLRSKMISSSKVTNPQAAARHKAVLAELQAQRQVAESERSQALAIRKATGGQGGAALSNSGAAGAGGPPVVAKDERHGSPGMEAPVGKVCLNPEIRTVNGKAAGMTFTPEVPYNLYAIRGCNFGDGSGTAHVYGKFINTGQISLDINFWQDDMILAEFPRNISGELDVDDVTLVVVRKDGKNLKKGGFKFYAARETVALPSIPQELVDLSSEGKSFSTSYASPSQGSSGTVSRDTKDKQAFSHFGTDYYRLENLKLPPGFEVDSFSWSHGRTDTDPDKCLGIGGGQYFAGKYNVAWDQFYNLKVDWGVWYCHWSPDFVLPGQDWLSSDYGLTVYVTGPRGVHVK